MADYRAIMALLLQGRSYRQIVDAVGCSHRDVSPARQTIDDRGLSAARLAEMSEVEVAGWFPDGRGKVSAEYDLPDFGLVVKSMKASPHFTLLQAWRTYVGSRSVLRKYGYAQYCHLFGCVGLAGHAFRPPRPARKRVVVGHTDDHLPTNPSSLRAFRAAGGLFSTISDLLSMAEAIAEPDSTTIQAAISLSTVPRTRVNDTVEMGLGWYLERVDESTIVWLDGAMPRL